MAIPLVITKIEGSLEESMAALIELLRDGGIKAKNL
jgi:hypothetical protein